MPRLKISNCLFAMLSVLVFQSTLRAQSETVELQFVDGNVIQAEVLDKELAWKTIQKNGSVIQSTIPWNSVSRLLLSNSPAFEMTERIGSLLAELHSPSYLVRENAEKILSQSETGGSFKEMISIYSQTVDSMEAKVRISRILSRLKASQKRESVQFDELTWNDESLKGDAGNFEITVMYRGRKTKILRSQLTQILDPADSNKAPPFDGRAEIDLFYKPGSEFYQDHQIVVDFSQDTHGNSLEKLDKVETTFVPWGMRLSSEIVDGDIVVSSYGFNVFGKLPKNNSIAVYERTKRFKGIVNIDFCMPNLPMIPAGVKEFGMFIARVERGRDFVLEGFDATGNLVVSVDSPPDKCGFMGFRSSVPVTHLRVLSNPYLHRVDRTPDIDFGLDHICYSKPVAVQFPQEMGVTVRLTNGDILRGSNPIFDGKKFRLQSQMLGDLELNFTELREFHTGSKQALVSPKTPKWQVMLKDGSQLEVKPGDSLISPRFGKQIPMDQVAALAHSANPFRYPIQGDFRRAKSVLVFPTCRIPVNQLRLNKQGFAWEDDASKILQPVDKENPLGVGGVDPTPSESSFDFDYVESAKLPTIWFAQPLAISDSAGVISTSSGEKLVFGTEEQFEVVSIEPNKVVLKRWGKTVQIPQTQITGIRWPE